MISRTHRFHGPNSLRFVYQNGKTIRGPLFATKSVLNPRRKSYRLAIVVSRKVHKSAVVRNRIRRRLYAIVREMEDQINQPFDIVITIFHAEVVDENPKALAHQVKRQLNDSAILNK
jgi:ribonuclease P protein component